jgi:hypothetical protein
MVRRARNRQSYKWWWAESIARLTRVFGGKVFQQIFLQRPPTAYREVKVGRKEGRKEDAGRKVKINVKEDEQS